MSIAIPMASGSWAGEMLSTSSARRSVATQINSPSLDEALDLQEPRDWDSRLRRAKIVEGEQWSCLAIERTDCPERRRWRILAALAGVSCVPEYLSMSGTFMTVALARGVGKQKGPDEVVLKPGMSLGTGH